MPALIIVDHGSRLAESNQMLEEITRLFAERYRDRFAVVEPAHMELAEPSIAAAYAACVKRGAEQIIVVPFFLGPGRHWTHDIPGLTRAAATNHPGTRFTVAPPLGIHDLMLELLAERAEEGITQELATGVPTRIQS